MSKGTRREREAADIWKAAGYATYRPATVQYGENDVFGLFDLLAVKPSEPATHGVQVKSNRASGIRAWARHTALFRALGWKTFYAVPVDGEGWRLIEPVVEGAVTTAIDERELECSMGDGLKDYLK